MNKPFFRYINSSYFYITILTVCVFSWVMWGKNFSIFIPWNYNSDAISSATLVKSFLETGTFWVNDALGFPHGYQFYDFPLDEWGNFFIMYIESFFTHNYAVVLNGFYFLTFLFSGWASVYTCKKLGLSQAFVLFVSLLFAFASYHVLRGEEHLFLSSYLSIPIYTLAMVAVFFNEKMTKLQMLFLSLAVAFCASTGVYYAFFASYFLFLSGVLGGMAQKNWTPVFRSLMLIGVIGLVVLISVLPSILYHSHYGANEAVGLRGPAESELYGLKITALLFPPYFSGFSFLQDTSYKYTISSLVGTKVLPSLGIIGSLGFLFLLFVSLHTRYVKSLSGKIVFLSTLNLSGLLLGTVGGIGALFAYLISPQIRCYDRISIFILYFSLLGLALFLERLLSRYSQLRFQTYSWLVVGCLVVFGLYDQAGHYQKDYISIQKAFNSDKNFLEKIEANLPKGSAIFQLPYYSFPEAAGIYHMPPYQCFKGYLNSSNFKWSCGAVRNRPAAIWQAEISNRPVPELLKEIIRVGFSGLYIDRSGYEDHGKLLETQIESYVQAKPIVSENNELAFFDLRAYAKTISSNTSSVDEVKT